MSSPRIAVVGGGIFGVTMAIRAAERGFAVELFEEQDDILIAASGINQYRLHRGYHYPRSDDTATSCRESETSFRDEYGKAVIDDFQHYYCIAREKSLTSAQEFRAFCDRMQLEYEEVELPIVQPDSVAMCVRVRESLYDPNALRAMCWDRLRTLEVPVHLGCTGEDDLLDHFDWVVVATYASANGVLGDRVEPREYQFEVCEKPVVRLPEPFGRTSIVVMDGPFMCVDPFAETGLFVMGNVVHAIHATNIGVKPRVDETLLPLLNRGIIRDPPVTNFQKFIETGSQFIPDLAFAEHVGSMYTIRAVLPYRDATDERPTIVERVDERVIRLFSGKVGTCVEAADHAIRLVEGSSC